MSFVYPSFLWALAALSIPVIIHLFNFRKTTRIYFSNTRLLRQVKQETTQKRKLKQYLVLASRLLFLLFLVFAFAQPFLPATNQSTSGKDIIVYLDNSYSMTAPVAGNRRAFDEGVKFVEQVVETFPPETRYRIITNDFAPFSNSFKSKTEVRDLLSQVKPSAVSRTLAEVSKRTQSGRQAAEVFYISDFQKSTVGDITRTQLDSLHQWHLVALSPEEVANIFVDSVYLENPLMIGGERNTITVKLRNAGAKSLEGLVMKLTINGVQVATGTVNLAANGFAETNFDLASNLKGLNEAKITISDFPISFDNELFFTLNSASRIVVAEIKAESAATYVEKVYGNRSLFDFQSMRQGNIDFAKLQQADVVILNGLPKLDQSLTALLQSAGSRGSVTVIIPAEGFDVGSYQGILPFANVSVAANPALEELDRPDYDNPFFLNVFEEKTNAMVMPQAKAFLQWPDNRSAVLKFKDGKPFLAQSGNSFLIASPLTSTFTDFYNHALFVPVMYRVAASLKKDQQKLYYNLSENIVLLRADSLTGEEPIRLVGSQEIIPPQRRSNEQVLMDIPKFSINSGYYRAVFKQDTLGLLAFNLSKQESLLDAYAPEEIQRSVAGNVSVFKAKDSEAFRAEIRDRYLGTPLWKLALALSLAFLLAEVLLIRFLK